MKVVKIDSQNLEPIVVFETVKILRMGGSIIFPTDTLYGLGVNATNEVAVRRLFKIKNRPYSKPVPIFVRDLEMLKKYVYLDRCGKEKLLESLWPGQVTVILRKKSALPDILTGDTNTIGVRIPDHPIPKLLVKSLGFPITATSANLSGEVPSLKIQEIISRFRTRHPQPDLILDAGDLPENKPSTILDLTQEKPRILRIGPVSKKELRQLLEMDVL